MFSVSPEPVLGNMLSPFHSQVQGELYSTRTYHPSANDRHWGVYNQYGTNETLKNMASFMDNGSCRGSGANAQVPMDL